MTIAAACRACWPVHPVNHAALAAIPDATLRDRSAAPVGVLLLYIKDVREAAAVAAAGPLFVARGTIELTGYRASRGPLADSSRRVALRDRSSPGR